jgi:hypothetical protein
MTVVPPFFAPAPCCCTQSAASQLLLGIRESQLLHHAIGIQHFGKDISSKMSAKAPDVNSYSGRGPCGKGGFCFAEKQFVLCPAASPLLRSPGS